VLGEDVPDQRRQEDRVAGASVAAAGREGPDGAIRGDLAEGQRGDRRGGVPGQDQRAPHSVTLWTAWEGGPENLVTSREMSL
jgi:hypothetical protein